MMLPLKARQDMQLQRLTCRLLSLSCGSTCCHNRLLHHSQSRTHSHSLRSSTWRQAASLKGRHPTPMCCSGRRAWTPSPLAAGHRLPLRHDTKAPTLLVPPPRIMAQPHLAMQQLQRSLRRRQRCPSLTPPLPRGRALRPAPARWPALPGQASGRRRLSGAAAAAPGHRRAALRAHRSPPASLEALQLRVSLAPVLHALLLTTGACPQSARSSHCKNRQHVDQSYVPRILCAPAGEPWQASTWNAATVASMPAAAEYPHAWSEAPAWAAAHEPPQPPFAAAGFGPQAVPFAMAAEPPQQPEWGTAHQRLQRSTAAAHDATQPSRSELAPQLLTATARGPAHQPPWYDLAAAGFGGQPPQFAITAEHPQHPAWGGAQQQPQLHPAAAGFGSQSLQFVLTAGQPQHHAAQQQPQPYPAAAGFGSQSLHFRTAGPQQHPAWGAAQQQPQRDLAAAYDSQRAQSVPAAEPHQTWGASQQPPQPPLPAAAFSGQPPRFLAAGLQPCSSPWSTTCGPEQPDLAASLAAINSQLAQLALAAAPAFSPAAGSATTALQPQLPSGPDITIGYPASFAMATHSLPSASWPLDSQPQPAARPTIVMGHPVVDSAAGKLGMPQPCAWYRC